MALEQRAKSDLVSAAVAPPRHESLTGEAGPSHPYAEALRAALNERSLSQVALAEMLGVTRSLVNQWVTGLQVPSNDRAFAIEEALEIDPPGKLTRHLGFIPAPPDFEDIEEADITTRLCRALPYLNEDQIDALVAIVKQFTNRRRPR